MLKYATFLISIVISGGVATYHELEKDSITITSNNKKIEVASFEESVEDILRENNIIYDNDDIINPSIDTKLTDDMNIEVIKVDKKTKTEYEDINFETKIVNDKYLLKGKSKVSQEGSLGQRTKTYEEIYQNGQLVSTTLLKDEITRNSVDKVVKKGIKEPVVVASTKDVYVGAKNASNQISGKKLKVNSTAYAGHTITATGTKPKWGTIAVDPKVIPYGTKVYIPQFNKTFVAEDCGGAIKGNKIDIFMNSKSEAYDWGRRNIDIVILD